MDASYIDRQIQQENERHKNELVRIDKMKTSENDLHQRKIQNLKNEKERIKQNSKMTEFYRNNNFAKPKTDFAKLTKQLNEIFN